MKQEYEGIDSLTVAALASSRAAVTQRLGSRLTVHQTNESLVAAMADRLIADYRQCIELRDHCVMIVPVGPVGQYQLVAQICRETDISLARLVLVVMDEYLRFDGSWIAESDPLSFRGHIRRHLVDGLPEPLRPHSVHVPDPGAIDAIPRLITGHDGVDFCYAGVGITGHLAFNEPEPGCDDPDRVANWPTRIVRLLPETRLMNGVTAAGGNALRIPRLAATVGMKEILSARQLRIWMNREWQRAAIRRMLIGPVTGAYPASLVQRHSSYTVDVVSTVLDSAEPALR